MIRVQARKNGHVHADLPTTNNTIISTFADNTALLGANNDPVAASQYLQHHLNPLQQWYSK
jgi:hypothetical protein